MSLPPHVERLWHGLGLGPLWRERFEGPADIAAESSIAIQEIAAISGARSPIAFSTQVDAKGSDWEGVREAVAACTACGLCRTRTQTVFEAGNRGASWMFIGEAPGAEEDARGEPFVGQAGRLLDNMLAAIGLGRSRAVAESVYIANVIKCRPPGNRNPEPSEVAACEHFLLRQVALLRPRLIVVMGRFAAQSILRTESSIASLRGRIHQVAFGAQTYPVVVTYHPAYLLRTLADKAKTWDDLCLAYAAFESLGTGVRPA